MAGTELKVLSGQVVALRLFDLAYEIDLKRAEELWAQRAERASERSRLAGTLPKAVSFGVPRSRSNLAPFHSRLAAGRRPRRPASASTTSASPPWRCGCRCRTRPGPISPRW
ncbi:hypothetical protein ACFQU2_17985 [Siccirubricoccus deserti]